MSDFYSLQLRKARRFYRCEQCGQVISPDERRCVSEGMWDESFFRSHEHHECMIAKLDYHHEFLLRDSKPWPSFWRDGVGSDAGVWLRLRHPDVAKRLSLFSAITTPTDPSP